jgi:hypothetical protein
MLLGLLLQQKRFKTFRKTPTKAFLKKLELGVKFKPKTETKFFRIIGGMKVYKSVSPGLVLFLVNAASINGEATFIGSHQTRDNRRNYSSSSFWKGITYASFQNAVA